MKNYGLDVQMVSKEFKTGGKYTSIGKCFRFNEFASNVAKEIVGDLDTLDTDIEGIKQQCRAYKEGDSPSIENVTKKFMGIYNGISK